MLHRDVVARGRPVAAAARARSVLRGGLGSRGDAAGGAEHGRAERIAAGAQLAGEHGGGPWADTVQNIGTNSGLRLNWTDGTGCSHAAGYDPLSEMMTALGNNPDAAHDFFTSGRTYMVDGSGDHDETAGYNEKLRYLMNERHWNIGDQPWMGMGTDSDGYYGSLPCSHEVAALAAACLLVGRHDFEAVGGFNENYASEYDDFDLCRRLAVGGLRSVYAARPRVVTHRTPASRRQATDIVDRALFVDCWYDDLLAGDPYFNPAFSRRRGDHAPAGWRDRIYHANSPAGGG